MFTIVLQIISVFCALSYNHLFSITDIIHSIQKSSDSNIVKQRISI